LGKNRAFGRFFQELVQNQPGFGTSSSIQAEKNRIKRSRDNFAQVEDDISGICSETEGF
jgi:hypothetical protein